MKDMDSDVAILKDLFREKVGLGWEDATAPNTIPQLVDARGVLPWVEVSDVMHTSGNDSSVAAHVSRLTRGLTENFYSWS